MAQLKYKDLILQMHVEKKSVAETTKNLNFRLSRSKLKTTLSESTVRILIKKYEGI